MEKLTLLGFADKINEIMPVLMKGFIRSQQDELYKGKITPPQFLVLGYLEREGESKMSQLAHFMAVSTAAMTGTVERLVRDGYALRVSDPGDRRIIKVKVTAKGRAWVKKIIAQRRQMIIQVFGKISESDRQQYLRILLKIKDILSR